MSDLESYYSNLYGYIIYIHDYFTEFNGLLYCRGGVSSRFMCNKVMLFGGRASNEV